MSLFNILKKVFNIQTNGQKDVEKPIRGSYSETMPGEWTTNADEKGQISEQIGNTALFIRGNPKDGYYLILGDYKITRKIEYLWKAREIAQQTDWETIMNVQAVMIETAFNIEKGINLTKEHKKATLNTHEG